MRLIVSAGGTGGHIFPALAIVAELQVSPHPVKEILWLGTSGEMEETLVPQVGVKLETIPGGGVHGVGIVTFMRNSGRLLRGWMKARNIVRRFRPGAMLLTGGYTNGPAALAAWEQRVPMVIFLPDIEPGMAIKVLGRLATWIACTTQESRAYLPSKKLVVTGYPIRPDLVPDMSTAEARIALDLDPDCPTLLVFGGSRGARSINRALAEILERLLALYQVIHISGRLDWEEVASAANRLPSSLRKKYRPFPFMQEELGLAMRAADLVVNRAGAATLGEFPAFGLPSILIPYPHAWRYQQVNADYLVRAGAAVRLDDDEMSDRLLPTIRLLMDDTNTLEKMRTAARGLHRPGAARRVAEMLVDLCMPGERSVED